MGKNKIILLVIFLTFLSAQFFSQTDNPKMVDQEELELILKKCEEYCERLKNVSLRILELENHSLMTSRSIKVCNYDLGLGKPKLCTLHYYGRTEEG